MVTYRLVKELYIADALSRASLKEAADNLGEKEFEVAQIKILPMSETKLEELIQCTKEDDIMQALINYTRQGWPETRSHVIVGARPYWNYKHEIHVNSDLVFRGNKVVIPSKMRKELLAKIHSAHLGMEKCKRRARDILYWPQINSEIEDLVSKCGICNKHKPQNTKEPLMPHEVPKRPWAKIGADLFEWNGKDYLLVIDHYSGYFELAQLTNTRNETVITNCKSQFARHGIPDTLFTDNGPQFSSSAFQQFSKEYQFQHTTSSPYHPQSNGMAEKGVQIAKLLLTKAKEDGQDPYLALLEYRNTPRDDVLGSPSQRLFGRRTKTRLPTTEQLLRPHTLKPDIVSERLTQKSKRQKSYYDRQAKVLPELGKKENVRVQTEKGWTPATVVSKSPEPRSYNVQTPDGARYRRDRKHLRQTDETYDQTILEENTDTEQDPTERRNETNEDVQTMGGAIRKSSRAKRKPFWCNEYVMQM